MYEPVYLEVREGHGRVDTRSLMRRIQTEGSVYAVPMADIAEQWDREGLFLLDHEVRYEVRVWTPGTVFGMRVLYGMHYTCRAGRLTAD